MVAQNGWAWAAWRNKERQLPTPTTEEPRGMARWTAWWKAWRCRAMVVRAQACWRSQLLTDYKKRLMFILPAHEWLTTNWTFFLQKGPFFLSWKNKFNQLSFFCKCPIVFFFIYVFHKRLQYVWEPMQIIYGNLCLIAVPMFLFKKYNTTSLIHKIEWYINIKLKKITNGNIYTKMVHWILCFCLSFLSTLLSIWYFYVSCVCRPQSEINYPKYPRQCISTGSYVKKKRSVPVSRCK